MCVWQLLGCEPTEDWWHGELNGRVGIFPSNYVEKQSAQAAPPPLPIAASNPPASATNSAPVSSAAPTRVDEPAAPGGPPPLPTASQGSSGAASGGPPPLPVSSSAAPVQPASNEGQPEPKNAAAANSNPFDDADAPGSAAANPGANPSDAPNNVEPIGDDQPKLLDAICKALFDFEGQDSDEVGWLYACQCVVVMSHQMSYASVCPCCLVAF